MNDKSEHPSRLDTPSFTYESVDEFIDLSDEEVEKLMRENPYPPQYLQNCVDAIKRRASEIESAHQRPSLSTLISAKVSALLEAFALPAPPALALRDGAMPRDELVAIAGLKRFHIYRSELDAAWVIQMELQAPSKTITFEVIVDSNAVPFEMERNDHIIVLYVTAPQDLFNMRIMIEATDDQAGFRFNFL